MFKDVRNGVKFGAAVLLLLALFAGAWWFSSRNLDAIVGEAEILNEGWLPGVVLLRNPEFYAHAALCAARGLPDGDEKTIDAARAHLEKLLVSLNVLKEHASLHGDLGALSRRLDEASGMARSTEGTMEALRGAVRESAKLLSEIEGALDALRESARGGFAGERSAQVRAFGPEGSGVAPEAGSAFQGLVDAVDDLGRLVAPLVSKGGAERADAVWEALSRLRVALRDVRMETFDEARLEHLDFMIEGMDLFQGALDAFLRSFGARRDLEWRAAAAGESLLDLVGGIRDIAVQESLALSGSLAKRAFDASKALMLSIQLGTVFAVLFALWLTKGK